MARVYLIIYLMIRLATININGMARHQKLIKIFESLRTTSFDVFTVQETH